MKTKIDFITNSSSTSFVMLGFKIKKNKKFKKILDQVKDDHIFYVGEGIEAGAPKENEIIIGSSVGEFDSEVYDYYSEINYEQDLFYRVLELAEKFNLTEKDIKLISTTRVS